MKTIWRSIPIGLPNKNGRIYPESLMVPAIEAFNNKASEIATCGQLGHPENADVVKLSNVTHRIKSVKLRGVKMPRKLKKKLKKVGLYNNVKQMYVDITFLPNGYKTIRGILASFPNSLALTPSMEGSVNDDGTVDVKRLLAFNFTHKHESTFKKYL